MVKVLVFLTKLAFGIFIALLFSSCRYDINFGSEKGSGNITIENRSVNEEFSKVEVSHGISLVIEQSKDKSITVEADDNLQKLILTNVENGVLIVKAREGYNSKKTPKVTVKMPVISGLSSSSGSSISSVNTLITENIAVEASSGSNIDIDVEADNISLETTSGSTMEVGGKALKLETNASSGSVINAEKLQANEVTSQGSSGSSTDVTPIISLSGKASSGASIGYHKIPKNVTKEESSGGSVRQE